MWEIFKNYLPLGIILIAAMIVCGADLIKSIKVWADARKNHIDKKVNQAREKENLEETLEKLHNKLDALDKKLEKQEERFNEIEKTLSVLTNSDMHDIKAWITEIYFKVTEEKEINAYTLDTVERRYQDYKKEGGNSYIDGLMARIRKLPIKEKQ